jgi:hypothetical protein
MGSNESNCSGMYLSNNHHHITWEAPRVTDQARILVISTTTLHGKQREVLIRHVSQYIHHHIQWEAPTVTNQARIPGISTTTLHGKHRE